jgi:hypothetical protein
MSLDQGKRGWLTKVIYNCISSWFNVTLELIGPIRKSRRMLRIQPHILIWVKIFK